MRNGEKEPSVIIEDSKKVVQETEEVEEPVELPIPHETIVLSNDGCENHVDDVIIIRDANDNEGLTKKEERDRYRKRKKLLKERRQIQKKKEAEKALMAPGAFLLQTAENWSEENGALRNDDDGDDDDDDDDDEPFVVYEQIIAADEDEEKDAHDIMDDDVIQKGVKDDNELYAAFGLDDDVSDDDLESVFEIRSYARPIPMHKFNKKSEEQNRRFNFMMESMCSQDSAEEPEI